MDAKQLSLQLNYMNDAAHLLATASPETSAYLMSRRSRVMVANELLPSDTQRQHVCGCCGHITVLGKGDTLRFEADKSSRSKRTRKSRPQARPAARDQPAERKRHERPAGPTKLFTCDKCNQWTKIALPPPRPIARKKMARQTKAASLDAAVPAVPAPPKPTANASAKKRAKNRKEGLQALLSQSQARPGLGSGLSLADFMKR